MTVNEKGLEAASRALAARAVGRVAPANASIIDKGWVIYADDARAAIEAYLRADAEPVAWQYRVHHDDPNVDHWWDWHDCKREFFNTLVERNASNIQTRALYVTHPSTGGEGGVKVKPEPQDLWQDCEHCHGTGQPGGIKGGPEHGLCSWCKGSGRTLTAIEPVAASPGVPDGRTWPGDSLDQISGVLETIEYVAHNDIKDDGMKSIWDLARYAQAIVPSVRAMLAAAPTSPEPSPASEDVLRDIDHMLENLAASHPLMPYSEKVAYRQALTDARSELRALSSKQRSDKE